MRANRRGTLVVTMVCCALTARDVRLEGAPAGQPAQRPTFRSGVELVMVDATVVDDEGRPVAGLGADDFEILIDGRRRRVVSAQFVDLSGSTPRSVPADETAARIGYSSNETDPAHPLPPPDRLVVLAIDHSSFASGAGRQTMEAARRFIARLDPSDRVALAAYPDPGVFVPPTTDHAAIARALGTVVGTAERIEPSHLELSIGLSEAIEIAAGDRSTLDRVVARECTQPGTAADLEQCRTYIELDAPQMATQLRVQTARSLTGFLGLIENLRGINGRKTLVLVSAGLVASERSAMDILADLRAASGTAAEADTVVHALHVDTAVLDAFGVERRRVQATATRDAVLMATGLDLLVGLNGGALFRVAAGADAALARIAREMSAYYVLGVEPTPTDRDGKPHAIKLRVPGRSGTVRHRRQFTIARPSAVDASPDEELATILRSGRTLRELPLRVSTQVMRDLRSNNVRVLVRADIGAGVGTAAHLRVGLAFFDASGQPTGSATSLREVDPTPGPDATWPFQELVTLRPGAYTLRLAAKDADGRVGSVVHRVDATLETGAGVRLSDLLVIDPERAGSATMSTIVDGRVRGAKLNTFVEVYPDRETSVSSVSFAIAGRGQALAEVTVPGIVTARPQEQRVVARAELDLRQLPAGEYVVTATAFDRTTALGSVSRPVTLVAPAGAPAASAAPGTAAVWRRFDRGDVLRPDALTYFLAHLRAEDSSGPASSVTAAAEAAARGEFDAVLRELATGAPESLSVPFLRGLALFANGEVGRAAVQFRASLRMSRSSVPAAFYLGACDAANGRDDQAVAAWQTVLTFASDAPIVVEALADAWLRLQDGEQAMAVLTQARERWPDDQRFVPRVAAALALMKKQTR